MTRALTRRVAFDARTLAYTGSSQRGIGHYLVHHAGALAKAAPDWEFLLLFDEDHTNEAVSRLTEHANVRTAAFAAAPQADLFHIPDPLSIMLGFDSPFSYLPGVPKSVLLHDLIPLVYAEHYMEKWEHGHRMGYRKRLGELIASEPLILTNSRFTREEAHRLLGLPLERMVPVLAGLNASLAPCLAPAEAIRATRERYGLADRPYFLVVGSVETYKRFDVTVNAFVTVRHRLPSQLVVVGSLDDPWKQAYQEMIADIGIADVVFTGFVARQELEQLYSGAVCLVHPAEYEGFGFPVLEAMARGCPVIACQAASIPEVAGEAAYLVPTGNVEALASAMVALATRETLRQGLAAKGLAQARNFSWDAVARRTIEAWEAFCFNVLERKEPSCRSRG